MRLSASVKDTRKRFVAVFPVPAIVTNETDDAWTVRIRQWNRRLVEQIAFEHPGQDYALKRGDAGRPECKDCLAQRYSGGLRSWDNLFAASSGHPTLNEDPDSLEIGPGTLEGGVDGQFFEDRPEFFHPQNHLGAPPVPQPPPPSVPGRRSIPEWLAFARVLDRVYREELHRPVNGNSAEDIEGLANWLSHWREDGRDEAWIRAHIRESKEWKDEHPGETP